MSTECWNRLTGLVIIVAIGLFDARGLAADPPASAPATQPAAAAAEKAEEILGKMRETYASCQSYQDEGEVVQVYRTTPGNTQRLPFKTWFERPNRFRYEFRGQAGPGFGPWHRYVVWADAKQIRSWWSAERKVEEFKSIAMALAGPTGISGGSAVGIPSLLIPEVKIGQSLRSLSGARLIGTENIDGRTAHKIEAKYESGNTVTCWIDAETSLVLKTCMKQKIDRPEKEGGSFEVESTTTLKPRINATIPPAAFEFDPEKSKGDE